MLAPELKLLGSVPGKLGSSTWFRRLKWAGLQKRNFTRLSLDCI